MAMEAMGSDRRGLHRKGVGSKYPTPFGDQRVI